MRAVEFIGHEGFDFIVPVRDVEAVSCAGRIKEKPRFIYRVSERFDVAEHGQDGFTGSNIAQSGWFVKREVEFNYMHAAISPCFASAQTVLGVIWWGLSQGQSLHRRQSGRFR